VTPPKENVKKSHQKKRYYEYPGNPYYFVAHDVPLLLASAVEKRTGAKPSVNNSR